MTSINSTECARAGSKSIWGGKIFTISEKDKAKLHHTYYGFGNKRDFIRCNPRLYLDVSKDVVKVDAVIHPTVQFAFVGKDILDATSEIIIKGKDNNSIRIAISDNNNESERDLHLKTSELLEIRKYIGLEGEDVELKMDNGLVFSRIDNQCNISLPDVFRMTVYRLSVAKKYVKFESSGTYDYIYVSRTKHMPF